MKVTAESMEVKLSSYLILKQLLWILNWGSEHLLRFYLSPINLKGFMAILGGAAGVNLSLVLSINFKNLNNF